MARQSFGKYEVLARLATGGAASIFLARQPGAAGFQKLVVLKTLLPERASDQDFVRMFLDEARLAARLHHPNCVQIYDLGRVNDVYYISMEYIFGETLWNLLTTVTRLKTPLPPRHVASLIANVCDGLHHAHELKDRSGKPLNLVHRDVSPQNIMVSFEGQTKVVDFGIAKAETDRPPTVAGIVKGKFSYMSPEQITGNPVDRRSDIYSLGIVMFECLASRRLYRGDTPEEIARLILEHRAPRLRDVLPDIPVPLDDICARALSRQPSRRFQSATAMAAAIREYLDSVRYTAGAPVISRLMSERFDDVVSRRRQAYEAALSGDYDESFLCEALSAKPVRSIDLFPEEPSPGIVPRHGEMVVRPANAAEVAPAEVAATKPDVPVSKDPTAGSRHRGPGWQVELATSGSMAPDIPVMVVDKLSVGQVSDGASTRRGPRETEPLSLAQPMVDDDRTRIDGDDLYIAESAPDAEGGTDESPEAPPTAELPTALHADEVAGEAFDSGRGADKLANDADVDDFETTVHEASDGAPRMGWASADVISHLGGALSSHIPDPKAASAMDVDFGDTPAQVSVFGGVLGRASKSLPPSLPVDDERPFAAPTAAQAGALNLQAGDEPSAAFDGAEERVPPSSVSRVLVRGRNISAPPPGGLGPFVSPVSSGSAAAGATVRGAGGSTAPMLPRPGVAQGSIIGGVSAFSDSPDGVVRSTAAHTIGVAGTAATAGLGSIGPAPASTPVTSDLGSTPRRYTLAAVLAALGFGLALGIVLGLSIARLAVLSTPGAGTVIEIPESEY